MSNENQRPADTRSASQKINDLENALMSLYQTADNMARDLMGIKEVLKLINNKLESVIKASAGGEPINDEVIKRIMVQNNCEELANKVKVMVVQGILIPTDQIAADSFLVGSEINDSGEVTNPRLQFALYAVRPEQQEKLKGLRVGDTVVMQEGSPKYRIDEVYQIQAPKQPEAAAAPAEAAASPAAEQSTTEAPAEAPAEAAPEATAAPAEAAQPDQSVTPAV